MLKMLRKKGVAKKVIWVVAIIIIISFGFLGTAYLITGNTQTNYAGKIFGKKVDLDDFNESFRNIRLQAMMKYGDKFRDVEQYLNLEAEAWDRLILLTEVNKRKIKINDDEVVKAIESLPYFQRDGQFDSLLYNDIIRFAFRIKPREFEESMRDTLKFSRLFEEVTKNLIVLDEDIFKAYKNQNEKVQISYVLFEPKNYVDKVTFDAAKAEAYYTENTLEFMLPPSINVEYIEITLPDEAKIDEATEENSEVLDTQDKLTEEILEKAALIREDLLLDPNMAEVAEQNGVMLKETGLFSVDQPNLTLGWSFEILNEIVNLSEGQVAGPFEAGNKIFVIKVKEKINSTIPSYEEAKDKVKDATLLAQAKLIASNKASELSEKIQQQFNKSGKNFEEIVQLLGFETTQTPEFNRGQYLPKIGISRDFQETAFSLDENNSVSLPVTTEAGISILHLDSTIPVKQEEYQKGRNQIASMLLNERRNQMFGDFLTNLRVKAGLEDNIAKLREQAQGAQ